MTITAASDEHTSKFGPDWILIPLRPRSKQPVEEGWPDSPGLTRAEASQRLADGGNVGVVTGSRSGLVVIDVDGRGGSANLARLKASGLPLPDTYTVATGRGLHLYYRLPEGAPRIGNSAGRVADGIDVRGDRGFVVAAGSVHETGFVYSVRLPLLPVAEAPAALLDRLAADERGDRLPVVAGAPWPRLMGALEAVAEASEGKRNDALNRAAHNLATTGVADVFGREKVARALLDVGAGVGLGADECRRTIASAGLPRPEGEPVPTLDPLGALARAGVEDPSIDGQPSHAVMLLDEIRRAYCLGVSDEGEPFAVPRDPGQPRYALAVGDLADKAIAGLYRREGVMVTQQTAGGAMRVIEHEAREAAPVPVWLRVAVQEEARYLDLGDGGAVRVTGGGWEMVPPHERDRLPLFRRPRAGTAPLPAPLPGERGRDALREALVLDADDPVLSLLWGWLVAGVVLPDQPRPMLWCHGPQGSGKTTRAWMLVNVLDPAKQLGREPTGRRDDTTAAAVRYLPTWDNVSRVDRAVSDWYCRLVTGMEDTRRRLYTDSGTVTVELRRSGVATSITIPGGLGPDAIERMIFVRFDRVPDTRRQTMRSLLERFDAARPAILAAVLDDAAGVLANMDSAAEGLRTLPRMGDYATVLGALDLHHRGGPYLAAYREAVSASMAEAAHSDPLAAALLTHTGGRLWEGTAKQLLEALERYRPSDRRQWWPGTERQLTKALGDMSEALRQAGMNYRPPVKSNGRRVLRLEPNREGTQAGA